ncbi:sensor of ECF-type sigma factor [Polaribacter tangerinus]|uniref:sensor of ECF-type sigma factor n=1 Tax=Polaribacter tangerinus TaxID=1920034 RepID=UPI0011810CCF|nr:sensor of ECF-type sigma factor [Polaribacter tangerinus]
MKKNISILILLLAFFQTNAQHSKESRDKIKALKIAFLSQELNLSSTEAQKFWPIYNKHQEIIDSLRSKGRIEMKNRMKEKNDYKNISEDDAKQQILSKIDLEREMTSQREIFIKELATFLSYKKIMHLFVSEREFARNLMRKYGRSKKDK